MDTEAFARIVLFQLASLRAEMIQTQRTVIEILEHQTDGTAASYKSQVMGQETKKAKERDRIFQEMLRMVKIQPSQIPLGIDSPLQNGSGHFEP